MKHVLADRQISVARNIQKALRTRDSTDFSATMLFHNEFLLSLGTVFSDRQCRTCDTPKAHQRGINIMLQQKKCYMNLYLTALILSICMLAATSSHAQPTSDLDITTSISNVDVLHSVDSLLSSLEEMKGERIQLEAEVTRLNSRILSLERSVQREVNDLASGQGLILQGLDTLRVLMPSDEPIRDTNTNVMYLSRKQDSLVAHIDRLEQRIGKLPDNHYWGVRNGFKQFDHLLLFTFLGAITSLGVVLLVKGGPQTKGEGVDSITLQEDEADRLSISITLLVGSILVILFIIFIL